MNNRSSKLARMLGEEPPGEPPVCPQCASSKDVVPILYGMPSPESILESEGKLAFGGCCVSEDSPLYQCGTCELDFTPGDPESDPF